jgi:nitrile hydratase beta subunit
VIAANGMGLWNLDLIRSARESVDPAFYLGKGYFDIWTEALEHLLLSSGVVTELEIREGRSLDPAKQVPRLFRPELVPGALKAGTPYDRPSEVPAGFEIGDVVRCRNINPTGHTRLPRYVRCKSGVVDKVHGVFVFPDTHSRREGEAPQWLYTVRFTGPELWGDEADANLSVSVDVWESYLEQ